MLAGVSCATNRPLPEHPETRADPVPGTHGAAVGLSRSCIQLALLLGSHACYHIITLSLSSVERGIDMQRPRCCMCSPLKSDVFAISSLGGSEPSCDGPPFLQGIFVSLRRRFVEHQ